MTLESFRTAAQYFFFSDLGLDNQLFQSFNTTQRWPPEMILKEAFVWLIIGRCMIRCSMM